MIPAAPTPSSPATAVGGEGQGRAEVVVDGDAVGQAPPPENADTTKAVGGQPAPGHDVFAGEPIKDIKSEPAGERQLIDKEFSTVLVSTAGSAAVVSEPAEPSLVPEVVGESETVASEANVGAKGTTAVVHDMDVDVDPVLQGPLEHDEQEAELVRSELYAEDAVV